MFLVFSISILATCLECPFLINDAICKSDRAEKRAAIKWRFFAKTRVSAPLRRAFFSGPTTSPLRSKMSRIYRPLGALLNTFTLF